MAAIGRRNVQEQNADTKEWIRTIATSFRNDPLRFAWLIEVLRGRSMPVERGILVALAQVPEQSGDQYTGSWLTTEGKFFRFSVLVSLIGAESTIEEE